MTNQDIKVLAKARRNNTSYLLAALYPIIFIGTAILNSIFPESIILAVTTVVTIVALSISLCIYVEDKTILATIELKLKQKYGLDIEEENIILEERIADLDEGIKLVKPSEFAIKTIKHSILDVKQVKINTTFWDTISDEEFENLCLEFGCNGRRKHCIELLCTYHNLACVNTNIESKNILIAEKELLEYYKLGNSDYPQAAIIKHQMQYGYNPLP